ncbi:MAG: hypothetical protein ACXQS3_04265 [Candidatus Methanofastidiosia archaeon]
MPTDTVLEKYTTCLICADKSVFTGISKSKCAICKGRLFCGQFPCPILSSLTVEYMSQHDIKTSIEGTAYDIVAGWEQFPNEPLGLVVTDKEKTCAEKDTATRENLIRKLQTTCCPFTSEPISSKNIDIMHEAIISSVPVQIEIKLDALPMQSVEFSGVEGPISNKCTLDKIEIIGNPTVPAYIKEIVNSNMGTEQCIAAAFSKGADPDYITKLFSCGYLGASRKFLPTRWAKTTMYNTCSNLLIKDIKRMPILEEPCVYYNEHYGNPYAIVFLPRSWEFELIEIWQPGTLWAFGEAEPIVVHEHETYNGISDQAMRGGGSYYASRLGVAELLTKINNQAATIVMRGSSACTSVPFGSGEVRTGVAEAKLYKWYESPEAAVDVACALVGAPEKKIRSLSTIMAQDTLTRWF